MFSIRRYLLATLLAVAAASMLLTGWLSWHDAQHEVEELFDAQLAQSARVLMGTLASRPLLMEAGDGDAVVFPVWHESSTEGAAADFVGHKYETRLLFQLWDGAGERLLMRSSNASSQPMAPFAGGYHRVWIDGELFHVFCVPHDGLTLQVAQDDYMRNELAMEIAVANLVPHAAGIPLMALLIWWLVARGLRPLDELRAALADRDAAHLLPVPVTGAGVELQPVVDELNGLLARLRESFDRERRFTADAAHELRTPLAVLRIQAENALSAGDDAARRHSLENLLRGVDRASRLVTQMLTLARLEPSAAQQAFAPVRLNAVVREELAALVPVAAARGQELDFSADDEMVIGGDAAALGILVRNLVDNALRYSPDGSLVRVQLRLAGTSGVELSVLDEGPGIPPEQAERIFERFYRGESGRGDGAGLGLAIVRRIVDLHRGSIHIRQPHDGIAGGFTVSLPR